MSGLCDTCRLKPRCISPEGEVVKCNVYDPEDKSRWFELFGTPERAARTSWYMLMCKHVDCDECPILDGCNIATDIDCDDGEAALLEWLNGESDG